MGNIKLLFFLFQNILAESNYSGVEQLFVPQKEKLLLQFRLFFFSMHRNSKLKKNIKEWKEEDSVLRAKRSDICKIL